VLYIRHSHFTLLHRSFPIVKAEFLLRKALYATTNAINMRRVYVGTNHTYVQFPQQVVVFNQKGYALINYFQHEYSYCLRLRLGSSRQVWYSFCNTSMGSTLSLRECAGLFSNYAISNFLHVNLASGKLWS
jgi:hypothetical protein